MQDSNNSPKTIDNLTSDAVNGNDIKGGGGPAAGGPPTPFHPHAPGAHSLVPPLNDDGSVISNVLPDDGFLPPPDDGGFIPPVTVETAI